MKRLVQVTWLAVGLTVLYVLWVYGMRSPGGREAARGGGRQPEVRQTGVKITQFYASTGEVIRGKHAIVCYGVENARAVRIEPPVEELKPSWNRCISITPEHDTTYTLWAEGLDGTRVSESFTVKVKPPPPAILFVALSDEEIRRGQPLTICYGVANATSARLEPLGGPLAPSDKHCIRLFPVRTTRFTFTASGPDGPDDREQFTVRVK